MQVPVAPVFGAVCPTGYNSNSSQAQFDGGTHYFGDVELVEPLEEGRTVTMAPSLSPREVEIYVLDEPYPIDAEDLFSSFEFGV